MIRSYSFLGVLLLSGVSVLGCNNHHRSSVGGGGSPPVSGFQISGSLPNATVGSVYSETLTAVGGAPPYSWSVVTGALPPGLSLSVVDGGVGGTPVTNGTFPLRVRVVDGGGQLAERDYTLVSVDSSVVWNNLALASGTVGQAYSFDLRSFVSGGTTPYTFTVDSGALPNGITLASYGVLSGTPTTAGSTPVTFRVSSASGGGSSSSSTAGGTITIN